MDIGPGGAGEPAIICEGIEVRLGSGASEVQALKGIDLIVPKGASLSFVGSSGSGKSTLLMVIAGLERATRGRVSVAGEDLSAHDEDGLARLRGREIGIVFQSFHLIPTMTALENVAVPLELAGKSDAFAIAEKELVSVGLGERLSHYPAQLSGGEQQRVAVARALAPDPSILLADEPTGNLDATNGEKIADLLLDAHARRGTTLVIVTHDPNLAARTGRIIRLQSGRIVETDATLRLQAGGAS